MEKPYPEVLGEWVRTDGASRPDRNLVAFLAVRDEVREAVAAGYSVAAIWRNLHAKKRIEVCYETFRRNVNRYVRQTSVGSPSVKRMASSTYPAQSKPGPAPPKMSSTTSPAPRTKSPGAIPGFTFNPKPNKEDLI